VVEKEKLREKESELSDGQNYERKVSYYKAAIERGRKGARVVHGKDLPWDLSRQGIAKDYTDYYLTDRALTTMRFFVHDIRTHSGKHAHQGGIVLFVLRGKGTTVVDDVPFDWSEGDLICLPYKKGGVVHQHFNRDGRPSRWLAMRSLPMAEMTGNFLDQKENHPMWNKK